MADQPQPLAVIELEEASRKAPDNRCVYLCVPGFELIAIERAHYSESDGVLLLHPNKDQINTLTGR